MLDKIASPRKRQRTEFIRQAIREAIRQREFAQMREAYAKQPDTDAAGEDFTNWDPFDGSGTPRPHAPPLRRELR
jgi:hypothetical protein